MTFRDRIYLTWNYGKAQFIVGAVYNLVCTRLLLGGFSYAFFVDVFILKAVIYAITFFLVGQFRSRDAVFFYINLGLSQRKLQLGVLLLDFLAMVLLSTLVLLIHG